MPEKDSSLRRVVAEVSAETLPGLIGLLGEFAVENKVSLSVKYADPDHTEPFIRIETETSSLEVSRIDYSREAQLREHRRLTYPQTTASFLGREHFWFLGDDIGIERRYTGALFTEVCFPITGNPRLGFDRNDVQKVDPVSIGITRKRRKEVGLPLPPISVAINNPTAAVLAHVGSYMPIEAKRRMNESVVQMRGLIDLGRKSGQVGADFTAKSLETLAKLMPHLVQFPD